MNNMRLWKEDIIGQRGRLAFPILTHPGIEMLGITVQQAVTDGEVHSQVIQAVAEKFPFAASSMIMDLSVEAEAFGAEIEFHEHEVPTVIGRLVQDDAAIRQLRLPSLEQGRIPQYLKAAQLAVKNISDRPVFAGCIGPFSLAGRLYGLSELMMEILLQPDLIQPLLEKCTSFLMNYCEGYKMLGADGIFMAEPAAGMLSPDDCQNFSSNYIQTIVEHLQDDHFLVILHNCGNTNLLVESMQSTRAGALHFGNSCDIVSALKRINPDRLVMGNLDPVGVFRMGSAEEVYQKTKNLLLDTQAFNNFIISSGCDIPPGVPESNINAFLKAVEDYHKQ
jgi:uroporphyrinogen decarboxylase